MSRNLPLQAAAILAGLGATPLPAGAATIDAPPPPKPPRINPKAVVVKRLGQGTRECLGCQKTISANKDFCFACSQKPEASRLEK